jgi:hypothetical protein
MQLGEWWFNRIGAKILDIMGDAKAPAITRASGSAILLLASQHRHSQKFIETIGFFVRCPCNYH